VGCKEHDHNIEDIVKDYRASCGTECKLFENAVFEELFDGSIRPLNTAGNGTVSFL